LGIFQWVGFSGLLHSVILAFNALQNIKNSCYRQNVLQHVFERFMIVCFIRLKQCFVRAELLAGCKDFFQHKSAHVGFLCRGKSTQPALRALSVKRMFGRTGFTDKQGLLKN
jgi:hypothetical protein